jgi:hypothetical protein
MSSRGEYKLWRSDPNKTNVKDCVFKTPSGGITVSGEPPVPLRAVKQAPPWRR